MKSWAVEKWQLWLKDESKYMGQVQDLSLLECHRMWLGYLRKRMREAAPDSEEGRRRRKPWSRRRGCTQSWLSYAPQ
jgi:hypothetical protein